MTVPGLVALQAGQGAGDPFSFLIPMALIFLIFYFLMIRPQQRRQKEHEQVLKSIEKGDRIVSTGGLHGVVTGTSDDVLTVEIGSVKGERVRVKLDRARVERRLEKGKGGDES
jgi:preprotein translocase subunit YajC